MRGFKKYVSLFFSTVVALIICSPSSYGQREPVPNELIPIRYNEAAISRDFKNYLSKAYDVTAKLPKGADRSARVDYTKQIQAGLDEHRVVVLPNFPVLISDVGLSLKSNSVLLFQPKSKLVLQPTNKGTYEMLRIHGKNNVKVFNANIQGDSQDHRGKSGEWGMGIAIRSSKNVEIFNAIVENCWGDGVYVGTLVEKKNGRPQWVGPSEKVGIYNAYINGNRRNGLSLVSVRDCKVYNSVFSNTRGAFPKSGIDIEPLNFADKIDIRDVVTFNNGQDGIVISLVDIVKSKIKDHGVGIAIDNHIDFNSNMGLRLTGYREYKAAQGYPAVDGSIVISNSSWIDNPYGSLVIQSNQSLGPKIRFINNNVEQKKGENRISGKKVGEIKTAKKGLSGKHSISFQ